MRNIRLVLLFAVRNIRLVPASLCGLVLACLLLTGCGGEKSQLADTAEGAKVAAELYYDCLAIGQYEMFLNGHLGASDMPDSYRQQLIDAYQQFMAQQRQAHGNIINTEATGISQDSAAHVAHVLLTITFADSVREEIVVPMIREDDQWLMR